MQATPFLDYLKEEINGTHFIMQRILSELDSTEAIVVDVRFNGGGFDRIAFAILSHFIGQSKNVLTTYARNDEGFTKKQGYVLKPADSAYSGKIFILTSPFTASAAEMFTMGSLPYKNIVRMGSRTNGIFSEILWKKLPNGWEFSLSNEV